MPELILWNSVAGRRRSPGDTFLENGLALLETALSRDGYAVEVVDWARGGLWESFTPKPLARLSHTLAERLVAQPGAAAPGRLARKLYGNAFFLLQESVARTQRRRQRRMLRELALRVRDSGCRVLGIKTWYGEAFTAARSLAAMLRQLAPGVLIVAGGPHASIYREAILEDGLFDLVVAGSGEKPLARLLGLARKSDSRGSLLAALAEPLARGELGNSMLRVDGRICTAPAVPDTAEDKIIPVYSTDTRGKTMIHVLVDSLGCPWGKCSFCVHSRIYPQHSLRPADQVVREIEYQIGHGIGIFRFAGSSTTLELAEDIAARLLERGLSVIFSMFARAETGAADPAVRARVVEAYRVLTRAGLRAVFLGAESGSDKANAAVMNKGARREDLIATVSAMREAARAEGVHLDIGLSLIYPAPTRGKFSLQELAADDLSLVEACGPDSVLVSPPAPFPGADWFEQRQSYGFELADSFVRDMLEYDYVLYKPPSMWPDVGLRLEGRGLRSILAECQGLRAELEKRGIITEVTDEHFLMLRAAGFEGAAGAAAFKRAALIGLLSCDYRWMDGLQDKVNRVSREIAARNAERSTVSN
ncbi:cobalamin-dependent protein [bacterium]|nr:cobalamin-dependent protein [bacterium]